MSVALVLGAGIAIAGILVRPFALSEAWWTCVGAIVVVAGGALAPSQALAAIAEGFDVYCFLIGMMLLSEIARRAGVFDWLAAHAVRAADVSSGALFALIYGVGVLVTTLLSNDATAVVMTPAVLVAIRRAKLDPLPYAYACAFVANAASFVLPISNPANLVLFGSRLPPLGSWLAHFALPSVLAIAFTFVAMRFAFRASFATTLVRRDDRIAFESHTRFAASMIALSACAIVVVSLGGRYVGATTLACAFIVYFASVARERVAWRAARDVQWAIVPMVAGLFVVAAGVQHAGVLARAHDWLAHGSGGVRETLLVAGATAALCNLVNNLPVGLSAASVLAGSTTALRDIVVVAVDLGPNLSVTGSLATVLWLGVLRREGVTTDAWQFSKYGAIVTLPALTACAIASAFLGR